MIGNEKTPTPMTCTKTSIDQHDILKVTALQQLARAAEALKAACAPLLEGGCLEMGKVLDFPQAKNLDNLTADETDMPEGDTDMSKQKKIRRPVMINGEKRWICGDTEQEYAENLINAMQEQQITPPAKTEKNHGHNFKIYAQNWFEVFAKPNVAEVTAITYERQLKRHIYPVIGDMDIEDVKATHIQKIFNNMGEVTTQTKAKPKMVLNMIFAQAISEDIVSKNPVKAQNVKTKGRDSEETATYSVEQMSYLVHNIGRIKKEEDRAFLALVALHPLSLEEALGLQGADVDGIHIYVRRAVTHPNRNQPVIKDPKCKFRKRRLDLAQQVKCYIPTTAPDEFIIGGKTPLSYTKVRKMCERIQRDTGFSEKITPIRFRTTVLTDLYDANKDVKQVQAAAGHSTAAMTLKHYVKGRSNERNTAAPVAAAYGL